MSKMCLSYGISGFELHIKSSIRESALLISSSPSPSEYIHSRSNPTAQINTTWHDVKNVFAILYYCKYACYNLTFVHYWLYLDKLVHNSNIFKQISFRNSVSLYRSRTQTCLFHLPKL